jgi:uncharacterized protein (DUF1499 family)
VKLIILGILALGALGLGYIRLAPVSAATWHVDPASVTRTGKPNDYLLAEGGDDAPVILSAPPAQVAAALAHVADDSPRTRILAGSAEEGFVTYIQRSALMGFPDMISVTIAADGTGSVLRIYSRARDGYSDMGVNAARVQDWIARIRAAL